MAVITVAPFMFQLAFSVGADEYTAHLSQAEFTPTQPTAAFTDIAGSVTNFGGRSGWVLNLAGVQDWDTANSLSAFLTENDGEDISVSLTVPGGSWAATVVGAATAIGGSAGTPAQFSTTLQVKGTPAFTPAG
jgi:hypothetical protein